jgi:hypothetical protein
MQLWQRIHSMGKHCRPIFPHYESLVQNNCWPNSPVLRQAQNILQNNGYTLECIARTGTEEPSLIICLIFRSTDGRSRIVARFPGFIVCPPTFLVYSITVAGRVFYTENYAGVFAGYYPAGWKVIRRPLLQNLRDLLTLHNRRIRGHNLLPLTAEPIGQFNRMQDILREANLLHSFIVARESDGGECLSADAGFRIWVEYWLMRYFGRPLP